MTPRYAGPRPDACQACSREFSWSSTFFDAKTIWGPWGILCDNCFSLFGVGIGMGRGAAYDWRTLERVSVYVHLDPVCKACGRRHPSTTSCNEAKTILGDSNAPTPTRYRINGNGRDLLRNYLRGLRHDKSVEDQANEIADALAEHIEPDPLP